VGLASLQRILRMSCNNCAAIAIVDGKRIVAEVFLHRMVALAVTPDGKTLSRCPHCGACWETYAYSKAIRELTEGEAKAEYPGAA